MGRILGFAYYLSHKYGCKHSDNLEVATVRSHFFNYQQSTLRQLSVNSSENSRSSTATSTTSLGCIYEKISHHKGEVCIFIRLNYVLYL